MRNTCMQKACAYKQAFTVLIKSLHLFYCLKWLYAVTAVFSYFLMYKTNKGVKIFLQKKLKNAHTTGYFSYK